GLAVIAAMLLVSAAQAADTDWRGDAPGKMHRISAADLPAPYFTKSGFNPPHIVPRPAGAVPAAPPDAAVSLFTDKLEAPRLIRIAPNGDIFVAETNAGQVRAIRATDDGAKPAEIETFARGLTGPFGIAFYPPGPEPQFVYIAVRDGVLRFPYRNGDLTARGTPEALISGLWSGGGHSTRRRVLARRQAHVRLRRLADQRCRRDRRQVADADSGLREKPRAGRAVGRRGKPRRRAGVHARRQEHADLRHRDSQLRLPADQSRRRRGVVHDQRARRPRRQPAARLRDLGACGRVLWLALVLHRRSSGPAPSECAQRTRRPDHRTGRADPAPFGAAARDIL